MNHLNSKSDITQTESLICGGSAGLLTRAVIAPFDLIKIRMQLEPGNGAIRTLRNVIRSEGLTALWKGNAPAELLYIAYGSLQFATLRFVTSAMGDLGSEQFRQLVAGGCAGSVATFVSYPLDFLRTRGAANLEREGVFPRIRRIYMSEGIKGFYHGAGVSVAAVFPYMALFFASYSMLRDNLPSWSPQLFTASSLASFLSKTAAYPLDTIRKTVQVHGKNQKVIESDAGVGYRYSHNLFTCGREIVQRRGIMGLYRGLHVSLMKTCPGSFLSIWFFEKSLDVMRSGRELSKI
ncbi:thiamine transporter [Starmerella bacillaris]|uniref:Thiamine transporter n=1 Tax=Starmerella bacillaris TaxID=1247836 RepID=A0AAV5RIB1_STABA|nr:thiamine transporter [Starmerella bacillaris]